MQNKIVSNIISYMNGEDPVKFIKNFKFNRLLPSDYQRTLWKKETSYLLNLINKNNINYILFKFIDLHNVDLNDIDLIIEEKKDINIIVKILKNSNYTVLRDNFSLNKNKLSAINKIKNIQVDIYPEATWFNMRYANDNFLFNHTQTLKILDAKARVLNDSMDVYIIATHSYNHGFISLPEVSYFIHKIKVSEINWGFINVIADKFNLKHALIPYLYMAYISINDLKTKQKIDNELHRLSTDILSKIFLAWVAKASSFPLKIPLTLKLFSSILRVFRFSMYKLTPGYDEILGYLLAILFRYKRKDEFI